MIQKSRQELVHVVVRLSYSDHIGFIDFFDSERRTGYLFGLDLKKKKTRIIKHRIVDFDQFQFGFLHCLTVPSLAGNTFSRTTEPSSQRSGSPCLVPNPCVSPCCLLPFWVVLSGFPYPCRKIHEPIWINTRYNENVQNRLNL